MSSVKFCRQLLCDVCLRHKPSFGVGAYRVYLSILRVWGNVPLLLLPSQSACTPVSSLPGPRRVDIRVKPFEAGLIASCMTVWGGCIPPTHWLYYVSHIVSGIGGSLCLSLLHYNAALASSCSPCEEACQDVCASPIKNFSHSPFQNDKCHCALCVKVALPSVPF